MVKDGDLGWRKAYNNEVSAFMTKPPPLQVERRLHPRKKVHIPAKLVAAGDAPQRDCVVLDISDSGAMLRIEAAEDTPEEFTIVFAACGRPYRRCRVVWRSDSKVGVQFDLTESSHTHADSLVAHC